MDIIKELPFDRIILFRPVYSNSGSCTELILNGGASGLYHRSIDNVRIMLARKYTVDLEDQGQVLSSYLDRRPPLPFLLPDPGRSNCGRIFLPLKMRKPRIPRDRAYGYVDLDYVNRLEAASNYAILHLVNGLAIDLFSSLTAARASVSLGREAAAYFLSSEPSEEEQIIQVVRRLLGRLSRIEGHLEQLTR
jgi:hypothetical protein